MKLCIRLAAGPGQGTWLRAVIVLIILVVVTVPLIRSGYSPPDVMTFFLGVGVAGTQAARPRAALTTGDSQW